MGSRISSPKKNNKDSQLGGHAHFTKGPGASKKNRQSHHDTLWQTNIAMAGISPFSIGNTSTQSGSIFYCYVSLPECITTVSFLGEFFEKMKLG